MIGRCWAEISNPLLSGDKNAEPFCKDPLFLLSPLSDPVCSVCAFRLRRHRHRRLRRLSNPFTSLMLQKAIHVPTRPLATSANCNTDFALSLSVEIITIHINLELLPSHRISVSDVRVGSRAGETLSGMFCLILEETHRCNLASMQLHRRDFECCVNK